MHTSEENGMANEAIIVQ